MADIMNRGDVIDAVAAEADLPQTKVDAVLKSFESVIKRQLAAGSEVRIANFGTFKVSARAARTSRNPRTGDPVEVPARTAPRFVAGKGLKEAAESSSGDTKKAVAKTPAPKSAAKASVKAAPAKVAAPKKAAKKK